MLALSDGQVRFVGLASILGGLTRVLIFWP
jgi:hypothetical protein